MTYFNPALLRKIAAGNGLTKEQVNMLVQKYGLQGQYEMAKQMGLINPDGTMTDEQLRQIIPLSGGKIKSADEVYAMVNGQGNGAGAGAGAGAGGDTGDDDEAPPPPASNTNFLGFQKLPGNYGIGNAIGDLTTWFSSQGDASAAASNRCLAYFVPRLLSSAGIALVATALAGRKGGAMVPLIGAAAGFILGGPIMDMLEGMFGEKPKPPDKTKKPTGTPPPAPDASTDVSSEHPGMGEQADRLSREEEEARAAGETGGAGTPPSSSAAPDAEPDNGLPRGDGKLPPDDIEFLRDVLNDTTGVYDEAAKQNAAKTLQQHGINPDELRKSAEPAPETPASSESSPDEEGLFTQEQIAELNKDPARRDAMIKQFEEVASNPNIDEKSRAIAERRLGQFGVKRNEDGSWTPPQEAAPTEEPPVVEEEEEEEEEEEAPPPAAGGADAPPPDTPGAPGDTGAPPPDANDGGAEDQSLVLGIFNREGGIGYGENAGDGKLSKDRINELRNIVESDLWVNGPKYSREQREQARYELQKHGIVRTKRGWNDEIEPPPGWKPAEQRDPRDPSKPFQFDDILTWYRKKEGDPNAQLPTYSKLAMGQIQDEYNREKGLTYRGYTNRVRTAKQKQEIDARVQQNSRVIQWTDEQRAAFNALPQNEQLQLSKMPYQLRMIEVNRAVARMQDDPRFQKTVEQIRDARIKSGDVRTDEEAAAYQKMTGKPAPDYESNLGGMKSERWYAEAEAERDRVMNGTGRVDEEVILRDREGNPVLDFSNTGMSYGYGAKNKYNDPNDKGWRGTWNPTINLNTAEGQRAAKAFYRIGQDVNSPDYKPVTIKELEDWYIHDGDADPYLLRMNISDADLWDRYYADRAAANRAQYAVGLRGREYKAGEMTREKYQQINEIYDRYAKRLTDAGATPISRKEFLSKYVPENEQLTPEEEVMSNEDIQQGEFMNPVSRNRRVYGYSGTDDVPGSPNNLVGADRKLAYRRKVTGTIANDDPNASPQDKTARGELRQKSKPIYEARGERQPAPVGPVSPDVYPEPIVKLFKGTEGKQPVPPGTPRPKNMTNCGEAIVDYAEKNEVGETATLKKRNSADIGYRLGLR